MSDADHKVLAEETPADEVADPLAKAPAVATVKTGEPVSRFAGNGVLFKAKLFGTAEVNEPRGDNVCNAAIALLKTAVKSTGEHKQKIFIRINYTGITLLDAINQLKLYEHPVHKISFISKDPNDNRAFGYIVSEAGNKHTYFGIKTEKTAEPVVLSLRDMFQAVFDLKKKEAEMKGESIEKTNTEAPAPEKKAEQPVTPVSPTTEPKLGDEADMTKAKNKPEAVQRENSSSHLLELLGDLSFAEPAPQATNPVQSQGQPWPPQATAAASWGNAVPAQNDPFAVQPQQNLFAQPAAAQQNPAFTQQPQAQSPFAQPFPQQQAVYPNQPAQMYNPAMYAAAPQQQQQQVFQQQAMFQQQPAAQPSPFAQQPAAPAQQSPFANDPFATNGFTQPTAQPAAPSQAANNPFASTGGAAFGVLQPQPAAQPTQAAPFGQQQFPQAKNLFSDLNPLPANNQQVGKDQFFNDVKNPPKPKLNEMQPQTTAPTEPAANNNVLW